MVTIYTLSHIVENLVSVECIEHEIRPYGREHCSYKVQPHMPKTGWKNTSLQMGVNILCGTFSNLRHGGHIGVPKQ